MKEGTVTKFDLERIITAIEHRMKIEPEEKPKVVVTDLDSDSSDGHVVNLDKLTCTCPDYEYNCRKDNYCKHIYRTVFEKHRML
jgi:hypothetical protein